MVYPARARAELCIPGAHDCVVCARACQGTPPARTGLFLTRQSCARGIHDPARARAGETIISCLFFLFLLSFEAGSKSSAPLLRQSSREEKNSRPKQYGRKANTILLTPEPSVLFLVFILATLDILSISCGRLLPDSPNLRGHKGALAPVFAPPTLFAPMEVPSVVESVAPYGDSRRKRQCRRG